MINITTEDILLSAVNPARVLQDLRKGWELEDGGGKLKTKKNVEFTSKTAKLSEKNKLQAGQFKIKLIY